MVHVNQCIRMLSTQSKKSMSRKCRKTKSDHYVTTKPTKRYLTEQHSYQHPLLQRRDSNRGEGRARNILVNKAVFSQCEIKVKKIDRQVSRTSFSFSLFPAKILGLFENNSCCASIFPVSLELNKRITQNFCAGLDAVFFRY